MQRRYLATILLPGAACISLFAISGANPQVSTLRPVAAQQVPARSGKHLFRPQSAVRTGFATTNTGATANDLYSGGGSVDTSPAVYLDYWGPEWQSGFSTGGYTSFQAQRYLNSFFGSIGGGYWLNSTTQYCQGVPYGTYFCGSGVPYVTNPSGQLLGVWTDGANAVPTSPTDTDITNEVKRAVNHFGLDAHAVYFIFTPSGKSQSGFGTHWCGWHGFNTGVTPAPYAYIPYMPDAGGSCGMHFINKTDDAFGHGYFDGFSTVAGHEYAEALTDPYPSSGWKDSNGGENGDKCAWSNTSGNTSAGGNYFAVQSLWSNASGGCSMGSFPSNTVGGRSITGPAAATSGLGSQDVFVVGTDHSLWQSHSPDNIHWGPWQWLGGYVTSEPSAVSTGPNTMAVFVRGADSAIWGKSWNGSSWSGWWRLGGRSLGGATAASLGNGSLSVFCRGTDGAAWVRTYSNGAWSPWMSAGGHVNADLSVVSASPGTVDLFARGLDYALWHRHFDGSSWSSWGSLGAWLSGAPDAASWGQGRLDVAMVGGDHALWRIFYDPTAGSWSGWSSVGGWWTYQPAVVDPAPGVVDFFVRGGDAAIYQVVRS